MQQKSKILFSLFIVFTIVISGCTTVVDEETQNDLTASSDEQLNTNLGDLDQLEQELNELDNLNYNDLDF